MATAQEIVRTARITPRGVGVDTLKRRAASLFDVAARLTRQMPTQSAVAALQLAADAHSRAHALAAGDAWALIVGAVDALRAAAVATGDIMIARGTAPHAVGDHAEER